MISTAPILDGLTHIRFKARRLRPDILRFLDAACDESARKGRHGIILDFTHVQRARVSTLGALIEVIGRHPKLEFAFCAVNARVMRLIQNTEMDRHLNIFDTVAQSVGATKFTRFHLSATRAVLDVPAVPADLKAATGTSTIAELDVLGRPLIEHFLANLSQVGIGDVLLCIAPEMMPSIETCLSKIDHNMSLFLIPKALASARSNANLNFHELVRHNLSNERPALVSSIDRLEKLALSTFAPSRSPSIIRDGIVDFTLPTQRNALQSGFSLIHKENSADILPPADAIRGIRSLPEYISTLRRASKKVNTPLFPNGEEIESRIWRGKSAKISPRARLNGFCYIGANASVEAEVALKTFSVIGKHATVARRSILDECVLFPWSKTEANQIHRNCALGHSSHRGANPKITEPKLNIHLDKRGLDTIPQLGAA